MNMFNSRSESLYDFFNTSGSAYYIPFYQRQYSWDRENVEKMMDDLYDGVRKVCKQGDYLRFIGTIILWPEPTPQVNLHYDKDGLITKIYNVIDGQQRISTLAVVAILMSERLRQIKDDIDAQGWASLPSVQDLMVSIDNRLFELDEFYSNLVKRANVDPDRKPIIIRAFDAQTSPVADQWTLNGDYKTFYRSDIGQTIAHYIKTKEVSESIENAKLKANIVEIRKWINRTAESSDYPDADTLIAANASNLKGFLDGDIDLLAIKTANMDCATLVAGAIKVLALIQFLAHKTYLTIIECPTEDLAFDMFQSLNATGTPLTAIEVFKPLVVNTLGVSYGSSRTKEYFDIADDFFDSQESAGEKEKLTDEVLLRMSLVHDGTELGKRFSSQRDWLTRAYSSCPNVQAKEDYVRWLSDITQYWKHIFQPRKPRRDSATFSLVNHLVALGLNAPDADLAALCIFYLRDANHLMAHYLLSLFYSKLLRAQGGSGQSASATEFLGVCKASAAFFTLWGATVPGFPDEVYRDLFKQGKANISWASGAANQNEAFVKAHFINALSGKGVFDPSSAGAAKAAWKTAAISNLGYGKKTLCRFALFVTSHNKAPDLHPGNEGLMVKGSPGSSVYLTSEQWYSSNFEVMEHIANRDKPPAPYTYTAPDPDLYPGNYSVVDKIGNLTLWSRSANSSTYPEWPEKAYYYATLTSLTPTQQVDLNALAAAQGIAHIPPSLSGVAAASGYVANLAPLAYRGEKGLSWDKAFVDKRTDRICDLLFDDLYPWLS